MAHQPDTLPWNALSTSLTAHKPHPRSSSSNHRTTTLTLTRTPAALSQRRHFARAFTRYLSAHAAIERAKHPPNPLAPPPGPNHLTNNPTPAARAALTVARARVAAAHYAKNPPEDPGIYGAATVERLGGYLAYEDDEDEGLLLRCARAQGWTATMTSGYADPRADVVMALVAVGEVLPLLRLARWRAEGAERSVLMGLWARGGAGGGNVGWSNVAVAALEAYVFLNVVFVREELWVGRCEGRDYRDDGAFARVLADCTGGGAWGIPHREFYGGEFFGGEGRVEVKRRCDPMRPEGLEALRAYLEMCWEHLVRVYVVLEEAGEKHDWEYEVEWTINELWDMRKP